MPINVERDLRRHWMIARATGPLILSEVLTFIQTARVPQEVRMWPLLFDARLATTGITEAEVLKAAHAVGEAVRTTGPRGHVALVAEDDRVYQRMLLYEAACADLGVRVIRVFRQYGDAEQWLEIVSAARHFH
jgi:hypothetical protein